MKMEEGKIEKIFHLAFEICHLSFARATDDVEMDRRRQTR